MVKHHLLGPSRLETRQVCPASYKMEKELMEKLEQEQNTKRKHKENTDIFPSLQELFGIAIEFIPHDKWSDGRQIKSFFKRDKSYLEDEDMTEREKEIERENPTYILKKNDKEYYYDKEDLEYTLKTIKHLSSRVKNPQFIHVNERLEYKNKNGEVLYFGTINVVAMDQDGQLMIFKWKTGIDDIDEIEYDLQIQAYVLAAMQKYNAESCKAFAYNPCISQRNSHTFTKKEKEKIEKEIQRIISTCTGVCPPTVRNFQCDYCLGYKHKVCPEWREYYEEDKDTKPEIVEKEPPETQEEPKNEYVEEISPESEKIEEETQQDQDEPETLEVFDYFEKIGGILIVVGLIFAFLILLAIAT
jgi:hypothetical protein